MQTSTKTVCLTVLWANICLSQSLAISPEEVNTEAFAVEGRIYQEHGEKDSIDKKLIGTNLTVFYGTRAYDQLPAETAVFDFESRTIYLIDQRRSVKSEVKFKDVLVFQAEVNRRAAKHNGLVAFLANPIFQRELDATTSIVTLRSSWITYSAHGEPWASDLVERFADFADWSTRLANLVQGSPYPAQARIELNKELRKHNWRVKRVSRTGGPRARQLVGLRCEREYRMDLLESDKNLIRLAEKGLKEFANVSLSEFLATQKSDQLASKK